MRLRKRSPNHQLAGERSKSLRSDTVEYGHLPDKNQSDMVLMMSKLLRKQAAPEY